MYLCSLLFFGRRRSVYFFFFFQAEDGIRDYKVDWSSDVCSSDLCQSAEQCWQNCCCMTLEERLIWARQNHVRPPNYALAAARAAHIEWAMNWPDDDHWQDSPQLACS